MAVGQRPHRNLKALIAWLIDSKSVGAHGLHRRWSLAYRLWIIIVVNEKSRKDIGIGLFTNAIL